MIIEIQNVLLWHFNIMHWYYRQQNLQKLKLLKHSLAEIAFKQ